jgi:hypothetical protein
MPFSGWANSSTGKKHLNQKNLNVENVPLLPSSGSTEKNHEIRVSQ